MLHKLTKTITKQIVLNVQGTTPERAEQIEYGLYVFFSDNLKLAAVLIVAAFLGQFKYAVLASVIFAVCKSYWGGIHAKTQLACVIMHFSFIFGTVYLAQAINFEYLNVILFIITSVLVFLYAPADLPTKPIISLKRKKELRIKGGVVLTGFVVISFLVSKNFSNIIAIMSLLSAINTTPAAYTLTKNKRGGIIT